jgi:FixJ family two-component response regulator
MPKKSTPWRIVVVEDDDGLRAAIVRMLNACGWRCRGFSAGEQFLASSASKNFDCLVLDIYLPGMSGFDLFDTVQRSKPEAQAILITALDEPQISNRIADAGATYLHKPFSGEALAEAVRHRMKHHIQDVSLHNEA